VNPAATAAAVPYTPAQIRHAYGFDQQTATGFGQKIAIVDAYGNQNIQSDLNAFCSQFGLKATTVQVIGSNLGGGLGNGWGLETSLDVEWAHVVAPDATIILSVAPTASGPDLLKAIDAAVTYGATVVSMSWGGTEWASESKNDPHFMVDNVTFVASSGDSGELTTQPEVEWPAVSPYVVSVGGTSLYLDANGNRILGPSGLSETAWSSSGGGLSSVYGIPSWQQGWNIWANVRGVPDVSYVADPSTGLYVYCSTYSRHGSWYQVGGTSAGAPQWAALIALANQGRAYGVSGNNDIYSTTVAGTPTTINANNFTDISSGSNGSDPDDMSVFGYDLVTGLGSPVATGLVPALVALAPGAPDFSMSATPASQTVAPGANASYTVNISALHGFGGTVTLSASGLPSGANASFNPASVTGSGSSTLSITTSASTPSGTYTITVTGTSASLTHTATVTLVVLAPDFSMSVTPASRTLAPGAGTSYTVNISTLNGFVGSVTLSASGLPGGASASFNPASVSGSGSSTLSITTSASTPTGTFTITVTGTSGSLTHTATVSLVVAAPDFSLSASPTSQTVNGNKSASCTVTVSPSGGFNGTVSLSATVSPVVSGGPTVSFNPTQINKGSGSSTMSIATGKSTPSQNYTITITGTSGSTKHSTSVSLTVR
jgi:subtilase family serine protease